MIDSAVSSDGRLTTHDVVDRSSAEEMLAAIDRFCAGSPTRLTLWDFTRTTSLRLSPEQIRQLAERARELESLRAGGRTAIVGASDIAFGMARMYEAHAAASGVRVPVRVFRDRAAAEEWLNLDDLTARERTE